MRGETLTDRQQEVLDKIREHVERTGLPPSRSELARSLGLAHAAAVVYHLNALEKKGWIEVRRGMDRGIQLLREGTPVFDVNTLPTVPAGTPALVDESAAVVRVPDKVSRLVHPQADFYVIVDGDSMDQVGYRSGDIVAVKRNPEPGEGEVVIAPHRAGDHAEVLPPGRTQPDRAPAAQQQPRAQADRDRQDYPGLGDRRGRRRGDDQRAADGGMLTERAPTMSAETPRPLLLHRDRRFAHCG